MFHFYPCPMNQWIFIASEKYFCEYIVEFCGAIFVTSNDVNMKC